MRSFQECRSLIAHTALVRVACTYSTSKLTHCKLQCACRHHSTLKRPTLTRQFFIQSLLSASHTSGHCHDEHTRSPTRAASTSHCITRPRAQACPGLQSSIPSQSCPTSTINCRVDLALADYFRWSHRANRIELTLSMALVYASARADGNAVRVQRLCADRIADCRSIVLAMHSLSTRLSEAPRGLRGAMVPPARYSKSDRIG